MANAKVKLGYKSAAWFTANATLVLDEGQVVFLSGVAYPKFKRGDDMTQLQNLEWNVSDKNDIGLGNVDNTSDANKPVSAAQAAADSAVLAAAEAYTDSLVIGLWDDRGNFDASGGAYPSTGGSGSGGAIKKGNIWTISVAGTLPIGQVVEIGDVVRALVDAPGNTQANWAIQQNNIGYTAENSANKSTDVNADQASNTKYPTVKAVYDWAVSMVSAALAALPDVRFAKWRIINYFTDHALATTIGGDNVIDYAGNITEVQAFVDTAGTTGVVTVDVKKNGVSIFSTKLTIDSGAKTSRGASIPAVLTSPNLAFVKGDIFTVDLITALQTIPAKGLTVVMRTLATDKT